MNSCCTVFYINDEDSNSALELEEDQQCDECKCHCGYIQFESLAPYMTELSNNFTQDDDYLILEAKLRQQIIEVSRLLDVETNAEFGEYSKAHYKIIDLIGNNTSYLKIPEYVPNTLELYKNGILINPDSYAYKDGFLIMNPCGNDNNTSSCGCTNDCGSHRSEILPKGWKGCYKAKAKFGKICSDPVVQLAVRSYLIELNTYGDVKETNYQGLPISRGFKKPDAWVSLIEKYSNKKKFFNQFGFA